MWLVSDKDKKALIEFFGNKPMPWAQSNPMLLMIAAWEKTENKNKDKNGKDKPN
jgi:hypothetical protein